ncbi:MAG TPA: iron ABC transporter permease [Xanthobacteraceae bacterium]|jgi:iron(III) transport system permease protein|nr:iron ABC transporter permease [Xanthobacteraceae bacterium]
MGGRLPGAMAVGAVLVSALALLPLGFIVWITIETGWQTAYALVVRPRVGELLINVALLEACTIPLAVLLGLVVAWLTERTDLPGARIWAWLAVAPLAVPAFVHSYAWVSLLPGLHGLLGGTLISVLAYSPFLYLPIAAQLRRLDPALEDVASSLGHAPARVFFGVVLPQLRLAICAGALLIGLHILAEYGLYVMIRFDTFSTAIVDQFQSAYNGPAANMMAAVLVACCLLLLALEAAARGNRRYARVGSGAARMAVRYRLGRLTGPCLLIPGLSAAMALGVPLITLGRWLAIGGLGAWHSAQLGSALAETLIFAIAGALLTTLAVIPMAWLTVRRPGRLQRILETCHYYVGSIPGVVIALALVTVTVRIALPLYQTMATLILAYLLLFIPRALIGLRASFAQAPLELEWAAMALGRTPLQAVLHVTLRLAAPGAAASAALVALGVTTELTATLLLAPNGTRTLATQFWALTSEIDYVAAAPYATLMVLLSLPLTVLLYMQSKLVAGR